MSTDRPRYTVSVDDELLKQIEDYQFEHRYKTRSSATVELIRLGIQQLMQEQPQIAQNTAQVPALSADEQQLIDDYRSLNEQGQEYIRQTMYMAKQTHKKMPDLSDLEKQA
ncbi:ribbon-helix-helix domain-containing protein [Agathobaculum sp.]|uniref:ribbon-helix-helix domain-containing protein n=1 Tax=Agathobaculum sp. TaxID=2048138 RepID=UPI003AF02385